MQFGRSVGAAAAANAVVSMSHNQSKMNRNECCFRYTDFFYNFNFPLLLWCSWLHFCLRHLSVSLSLFLWLWVCVCVFHTKQNVSWRSRCYFLCFTFLSISASYKKKWESSDGWFIIENTWTDTCSTFFYTLIKQQNVADIFFTKTSCNILFRLDKFNLLFDRKCTSHTQYVC